MSEAQEDKRARQEAQALAMRQQLWAGVDPSVIEQWAGMVPAGFQFGDSRDTNAAMNWAPGRVMTPEEVQQVVGNVANYTLGSEGMDLARYLADPRAAIKVEGGQYVYRPEALRPEDDFQGIPKTGFWDGMGPAMLPLIAFGAGPYAASLGAYGGAAAAGAEAGGSAAAGGAAGDFSLHTAGSGFGGVGSGGVGLTTGTSGGAGALGAGAGTATGAGLGLQAVTTAGAPLTGATLGAGAAAGGGFWETLLNTVTSSPGTTGASTLANFLKGGGSLLEWLQSKDNADELQKALMAAADRGDPFASQRPFYQNMLRDSYTNPDFWKNNAVFKGISDVASSDAQRQAAARGFNNSSNVLYDVADRIQKTGMNYATGFQGQLAQNAGAGISPGASANIAAQGANQVMGANQQSNGALGNFVSNIPGMVNSIKGLLA